MLHVRRRQFITLLGGAAAAWPLAARAQQSERMRQVGLIMASAETDPEAQQRVRIFRQALNGLGWIEGVNLEFTITGLVAMPNVYETSAYELVGKKPDLIVAHSTPVVLALKQLTPTDIPIVFVSVSDPIGDGIIASFHRPGGNITGFTNIEGSISGKWLELLTEIAPNVSRFTFIYNPRTAPGGGSYFLAPFQAAASSLNLNTTINPVNEPAEIDDVVAAVGREPNSGLVVSNDIFTVRHRERIISLAARNRVRAIYPFRFFAIDGGLIAYGTDLADLFRRSATYVDRILKGEHPRQLPVQSPVKFELIINLKTAKALGLEVPPSLLARADEVIE